MYCLKDLSEAICLSRHIYGLFVFKIQSECIYAHFTYIENIKFNDTCTWNVKKNIGKNAIWYDQRSFYSCTGILVNNSQYIGLTKPCVHVYNNYIYIIIHNTIDKVDYARKTISISSLIKLYSWYHVAVYCIDDNHVTGLIQWRTRNVLRYDFWVCSRSEKTPCNYVPRISCQSPSL